MDDLCWDLHGKNACLLLLLDFSHPYILLAIVSFWITHESWRLEVLFIVASLLPYQAVPISCNEGGDVDSEYSLLGISRTSGKCHISNWCEASAVC